jgi:hypothetical protein
MAAPGNAFECVRNPRRVIRISKYQREFSLAFSSTRESAQFRKRVRCGTANSNRPSSWLKNAEGISVFWLANRSRIIKLNDNYYYLKGQ